MDRIKTSIELHAMDADTWNNGDLIYDSVGAIYIAHAVGGIPGFEQRVEAHIVTGLTVRDLGFYLDSNGQLHGEE